MRKQLYWLSDEEWQRIEPLLPRGRRGARRVDDRRVISGIVHMLRSGGRWRDCPPEYGPYTTIYNRFNRWRASGRRTEQARIVICGREIALKMSPLSSQIAT
jgi:transposase